ncbi:hypothetical protein RD792_016825 [Penstemon davidsonii]|uniref:Pentatricopeptide repeat-containing protein n=1 Tax=Penstemon davidsonii TaxID=160366 RepID=A0ABR0CKE3_9LAMI|nr:hypothetical protein RD792_016825 [Penstemon davidsonii]
MISGLVKAGELKEAKKLFDEMPERDKVSWNAILDGYVKAGEMREAFELFERMPFRDVVSWSTVISGYAKVGDIDMARLLDLKPDKVTLVGVLSACNHAGLVKEGTSYFHGMENDYGIIPEIELYGCVIDLLGRGGHLTEAFRLLHAMPFEPNVVIWSSLLGACRMHNAVELAEEEQNQLVKLETTDAGNFSMLSNIYAAAEDWENVSNARLQMRKTASKRPSGVSIIELNDDFHEFTVMDTTHPSSDRIYQTISGLSEHLRKISYAPNVFV